MNAIEKYREIIERIAAEFRVDPDLVRAFIFVESSGNTWAIRTEPGFYKRYILPLVNSRRVRSLTEARARSISWGLMQVMGQVAREHGFAGKYLSELCDPELGIRYGVMHFRKFLDRYGAAASAVAAYNAGSARYRNGRFVNQEYVDKVEGAHGRFRDGRVA